MDEAEWQDAIVRKDWQRTVPFALDAPRYRNELRIIATAQGLAAFFTIDICAQRWIKLGDRR